MKYKQTPTIVCITIHFSLSHPLAMYMHGDIFENAFEKRTQTHNGVI